MYMGWPTKNTPQMVFDNFEQLESKLEMIQKVKGRVIFNFFIVQSNGRQSKKYYFVGHPVYAI